MKQPAIVNTLGLDDSEIERNIKLGNWERCEYCKCVFDWEMLPDENVLRETQSHPYGSTVAIETYVTGFVCPECGYKTTF